MIPCPYCGSENVHHERTLRGSDGDHDVYRCDDCRNEWDERV